MMRPITVEDHVRAVRECRSQQFPLVTSDTCKAWFRHEGIDFGELSGRAGKHFERVDNLEASGQRRLVKFKRSNTDQNADVAWCLAEEVDAARIFARRHGWLEIPWDGRRRRWDWRRAA